MQTSEYFELEVVPYQAFITAMTCPLNDTLTSDNVNVLKLLYHADLVLGGADFSHHVW